MKKVAALLGGKAPLVAVATATAVTATTAAAYVIRNNDANTRDGETTVKDTPSEIASLNGNDTNIPESVEKDDGGANSNDTSNKNNDVTKNDTLAVNDSLLNDIAILEEQAKFLESYVSENHSIQLTSSTSTDDEEDAGSGGKVEDVVQEVSEFDRLTASLNNLTITRAEKVARLAIATQNVRIAHQAYEEALAELEEANAVLDTARSSLLNGNIEDAKALVGQKQALVEIARNNLATATTAYETALANAASAADAAMTQADSALELALAANQTAYDTAVSTANATYDARVAEIEGAYTASLESANVTLEADYATHEEAYNNEIARLESVRQTALSDAEGVRATTIANAEAVYDQNIATAQAAYDLVVGNTNNAEYTNAVASLNEALQVRADALTAKTTASQELAEATAELEEANEVLNQKNFDVFESSKALRSATARYEEASAALEAAEAAQATASGNVTANTAAVQAATAAKQTAENDLQTANEEYDALIEELNSTVLDVEAAQAKVNAKQVALDQANTQIALGSYGFFQSVNKTEAMAILTRCTSTDYTAEYRNTDIGAEGDATSLENMKIAIDWIEAGNTKRTTDDNVENLEPLKVNDSLMAIAQVNANYQRYLNSDTIDHWRETGKDNSAGWNTGENLSWMYDNPYDGWYDEEKAVYDWVNNYMATTGETSRAKAMQAYRQAFHTNESQTGHYTNIIRDHYTITGFGFSNYDNSDASLLYLSPRYSPANVLVHAQEFGSQYSLITDKESFTVEEYRQRFMTYYNAVMDAKAQAQRELDEAKAELTAVQNGEVVKVYTEEEQALIRAANQKIANAEQVLAGAEQVLTGAEATLADSVTALAEADATVATLTTSVNALSARMAEIQEDVDADTTGQATASAEVTRLTQVQSEKQTAYDNAVSAYETADADVIAKQQAVANAEATISDEIATAGDALRDAQNEKTTGMATVTANADAALAESTRLINEAYANGVVTAETTRSDADAASETTHVTAVGNAETARTEGLADAETAKNTAIDNAETTKATADAQANSNNETAKATASATRATAEAQATAAFGEASLNVTNAENALAEAQAPVTAFENAEVAVTSAGTAVTDTAQAEVTAQAEETAITNEIAEIDQQITEIQQRIDEIEAEQSAPENVIIVAIPSNPEEKSNEEETHQS